MSTLQKRDLIIHKLLYRSSVGTPPISDQAVAKENKKNTLHQSPASIVSGETPAQPVCLEFTGKEGNMKTMPPKNVNHKEREDGGYFTYHPANNSHAFSMNSLKQPFISKAQTQFRFVLIPSSTFAKGQDQDLQLQGNLTHQSLEWKTRCKGDMQTCEITGNMMAQSDNHEIWETLETGSKKCEPFKLLLLLNAVMFQPMFSTDSMREKKQYFYSIHTITQKPKNIQQERSFTIKNDEIMTGSTTRYTQIGTVTNLFGLEDLPDIRKTKDVWEIEPMLLIHPWPTITVFSDTGNDNFKTTTSLAKSIQKNHCDFELIARDMFATPTKLSDLEPSQSMIFLPKDKTGISEYFDEHLKKIIEVQEKIKTNVEKLKEGCLDGTGETIKVIKSPEVQYSTSSTVTNVIRTINNILEQTQKNILENTQKSSLLQPPDEFGIELANLNSVTDCINKDTFNEFITANKDKFAKLDTDNREYATTMRQYILDTIEPLKSTIDELQEISDKLDQDVSTLDEETKAMATKIQKTLTSIETVNTTVKAKIEEELQKQLALLEQEEARHDLVQKEKELWVNTLNTLPSSKVQPDVLDAAAKTLLSDIDSTKMDESRRIITDSEQQVAAAAATLVRSQMKAITDLEENPDENNGPQIKRALTSLENDLDQLDDENRTIVEKFLSDRKRNK